MNANAPVQDLLINNMPLDDLDAIGRQAERRGWSRVQMIRHILAQAAARERSKAEKAAAASQVPA